MDEILIIVLFFLGAIILPPVIILVKIGSLRKDMRQMNEKINTLLMVKTQPATPEKAADIQPTMENIPAQAIQEMPEIQPQVYQMPEIRPRSDGMLVLTKDTIPESGPDDICPETTSPVIPNAVEDEPPLIPETKQTDDRNIFEKLLGTNWLSKIGIITFVLGIGFFVKYAIDQNWINEIGRVGIGLLTGGIIIGIAHKLRTSYRVFSSLLAGGGISVFYMTITLAFREYALFGQTPAFVLLIVTTLFSVLLSLLYDRKDLAVFSLFGGFASPLMVSTGVGSYIVLFSYIFILNTGMLIVSYLKQWRIIGMISFVLTLFFFGFWLVDQFNAALYKLSNKPYYLLSLFVALFYMQFYLLALVDHLKSGKKISVYQILLILINNLFVFSALMYILDTYSLNIRGLITLILAVINAIVLVILFRNQRIDRNLIYLVIALVLSFVSLAIPIQLKGHAITLFWAAETVILLWLWQKSQIKIFYLGFILILVLTFCSYFMDIHNLYSHTKALPVVVNRLFITGAFVIAALTINLFLLKHKPDKTRISTILELAILTLAYIVPMIELNMQLAHYTDIASTHSTSFRFASLATFTTIYIAVLSLIYRTKIATKKYIFGLFYASLILYAIFFAMIVTDLRFIIFGFHHQTYPASYFSVHLFALPAIACIIYLISKNLKSMSKKSDWLGWLLTVIVVAIVSVETDHIVVWIMGNTTNYARILHDVHTFGYPVLWAVIAMIVMIWGLNRKEALLRQIALVFFGLIIIKFYAYDVWNMSQFGRVISFVLLGVILLLVSFLQQKIRTLVKDNEHDNKTEIIQ